jgi:hypothetical protein
MLRYLFDSEGRYIAVLADEDRLHTPDGNHVGDYVEEYRCFFDLKGKYLGHLVEPPSSSALRLLKASRSKLRELNLEGVEVGRRPNYGNIGKHVYDGQKQQRGGGYYKLLGGWDNVQLPRG